jgi:YggT family protein
VTDHERTTTSQTETVVPGEGAATASSPPTGSTGSRSTVRTTQTARTASGPSGTTMAARVVTFAFGILQALLILRIVLLLLIANPGNDIVRLILDVTQPFVSPFVDMFSLDRVEGDQGSVLDIAAIVALIAWTLIEALILAALRIFRGRSAEVVA